MKLTNKEYHGINDYIGSTTLKAFQKNPRKAIYEMQNKQHKEIYDFGSYYHTAILEPELLEKEYFVFNPDNRPFPEQTFGKKENKIWKEEQEQNTIELHKTFFSLDNHNIIMEMKKELFKYPRMQDICTKYNNPEESYLVEGFVILCNKEPENNDFSYYTELSNGVKVYRNDKGFWKIYDPKLKLEKCYSMNAKVRPDIDTSHFLGDLKTCSCNDPRKFIWTIKDLGYDLQGAYYTDVYFTATGIEKPLNFHLITQEKTPPYNVEIPFELSDEILEEGRLKYLESAYRLLKYKATGETFGYIEPEEGQFSYKI